jgi:hypothetical protein
VPWVAPKLVPVIVTGAPTAPVVGDRLVMLGADTTVNVLLLLATPLTVTTTPPVVAPVGTVATIELAPQLVIVVAVIPLKVNVLDPCGEPKFVPVIVTEAPTAPVVGDRLVIVGAAKELPERSAHRRLTPIRRHAVCVKIYSSYRFDSLQMHQNSPRYEPSSRKLNSSAWSTLLTLRIRNSERVHP